MKGNLSLFEARVKDVMKDALQSFKTDIDKAIGYIPKQKEANTQANNKSILEKTVPQETNTKGNDRNTLVEEEQEETR